MAVRQSDPMAIDVSTQERIVLSGKTYEDYLAADEQYPHLRIEYIEGTIVMSPSPVPNHQRVLRNLFQFLDRFVSTRRLGEILWAPLDVELSPKSRIVEPDLIFIVQERIAELVGEKQITGAPDLVVEILSPRTARMDRKIKLPLYARSGVPEYWIVDLDDRAVEIYLLAGETYRVAGIFLADETITAGRFAEAQIVVEQLFEFA
jgi:Uma2 family endonuclease